VCVFYTVKCGIFDFSYTLILLETQLRPYPRREVEIPIAKSWVCHRARQNKDRKKIIAGAQGYQTRHSQPYLGDDDDDDDDDDHDHDDHDDEDDNDESDDDAPKQILFILICQYSKKIHLMYTRVKSFYKNYGI